MNRRSAKDSGKKTLKKNEQFGTNNVGGSRLSAAYQEVPVHGDAVNQTSDEEKEVG